MTSKLVRLPDIVVVDSLLLVLHTHTLSVSILTSTSMHRTYSLLHIPLRGRLILGMFTTFILVSDWESKWWWERGRQPMM